MQSVLEIVREPSFMRKQAIVCHLCEDLDAYNASERRCKLGRIKVLGMWWNWEVAVMIKGWRGEF